MMKENYLKKKNKKFLISKFKLKNKNKKIKIQLYNKKKITLKINY
jgi:hypothetical protein